VNNWQFFATVYTEIDAPVEGAVNGLIAAMSAYLSPIMLALGVIYIAGMAMVTMSNPSQDVVHGFLANILRVAMVYFIVSSATNFTQYFGTIFMTTLPTEIGNAVSGATGAQVINGGAFDTVWNKAWTAGLVVYKIIPWTLKGIALSIMIVVYWVMGILTMGVSFLIYLGCHISLALVVGLGPLFVLCFLFPATRRFFEGWIAALVSLVLTQILTIALLSLLINTENTTIAQIATNGGGDNVILEFQMLLYAMVLFALCAWIALQLPGIATGIAGGVYHQTSVYSQIVFGGAASIGRGAAGIPGSIARAIRSGGDDGNGTNNAGSTASASGSRQPVGRSLSDSGRAA
jgi:type IV secretion system protein VirB6